MEPGFDSPQQPKDFDFSDAVERAKKVLLKIVIFRLNYQAKHAEVIFVSKFAVKVQDGCGLKARNNVFLFLQC